MSKYSALFCLGSATIDACPPVDFKRIAGGDVTPQYECLIERESRHPLPARYVAETLPAIGLAWLDSPWADWTMVVLAATIALRAHRGGLRRTDAACRWVWRSPDS